MALLTTHRTSGALNSYYLEWSGDRYLKPYLSNGTINPYAAGGYFGQYKMTQKYWKMTETLAYGHSSEGTLSELSNGYQHDRVRMFFKSLCILVLWTKVATAFEGLNPVCLMTLLKLPSKLFTVNEDAQYHEVKGPTVFTLPQGRFTTKPGSCTVEWLFVLLSTEWLLLRNC